jgi:hypothetical protein
MAVTEGHTSISREAPHQKITVYTRSASPSALVAQDQLALLISTSSSNLP